MQYYTSRSALQPCISMVAIVNVVVHVPNSATNPLWSLTKIIAQGLKLWFKAYLFVIGNLFVS